MRPGSKQDPYASCWDWKYGHYFMVQQLTSQSGWVLKKLTTWLPGEDPGPKLEQARKELRGEKEIYDKQFKAS